MFGLREPVNVYVPVLKAQLSVVSNKLDELSRFSQFILYAIGSGEDYDEILKVTQLGSIVIEEEMLYLMKIGLLTHEESLNLTSLTKHGQELFEIIVKVDAFNTRKEVVLINCLTGDLEALNNNELLNPNEIDPNLVSLKEKIIRELYQNQDPFNSREFVFEQYQFGVLDEEKKEDIHVEIRYGQDLFYLKRGIKNVPIPDYQEAFFQLEPDTSFDFTKTDEEQTYLFIERDFYKLNLSFSYNSLLKYRSVLSTLNRLQGFESDLISKKAANLLSLEKKEQELNQQDHSFYYDPVTGYCYLDCPNYPYVTKKTNTIDIKLPESYRSNQISGVDIFKVMGKFGHEEEKFPSSKRNNWTRIHPIFGDFDQILGRSLNKEKKNVEQTEKDLMVEVKVLESHKVVQKVPATVFF